MGVWIETRDIYALTEWLQKSHPAWVCGLKLYTLGIVERWKRVTPCVGVWIETDGRTLKEYPVISHTLRGCVD